MGEDRSATTADGTIGWVFRNAEAADAGARRLRSAGFSDVRVSEGDGTTSEAHVPESAGLTSTDFAARLEAVGFDASDARALTADVARGGVLVTLAAGSRVERALAALRGEVVAAESLHAVDLPGGLPVPPAPQILDDPDMPKGELPETGDARTLELREEGLVVRKQREASEARIRKETVVEERTITVPVRREQLVIERDGEATVRIPLSDDDA